MTAAVEENIVKTEKYENFIPPMSQSEFYALKDSIAKDGLHYAIIKNQHGYILDGHHRLKACRELGIEPRFEVKEFDNELLERKFVYEINRTRRHWNKFQKAELDLLILEPIEKELAERRMKAGTTLAPFGAKGKTSEHIAKKSNGELSSRTYERAMAIIRKAPEQLKEEVRRGKKTINYAYQQVMRSEDRNKEKPPLPEGQYDVLYIDPPWDYNFSAVRGSPEDHYAVMTDEEIKQLKIPAADSNAVLFLWVPYPKNKDAFSVLDAWGFQYKSKIIWVKDKIGTGHYVRGKHEELFICIKGKGLGLPAEEDRPESVFFAERQEHSKKPDIVYEMIESMYPHRQYLELFARGKPRPGWKAWGAEVEGPQRSTRTP